MKVIDIAENIIYIEDAFPHWKEFIDAIEANDTNPDINPVIPQWSDWYDSRPKRKYEDNDLMWEQLPDDFTKGKQKLFDWDITITDRNSYWPRPITEPSHSKAHELAAPIIDLIYKDYLKCLDVWYEKTGQEKLEYVSRNFLLRKYNNGGMIGPHIDKNHENPMNTMDWTALIYLNDDYEDGQLKFVGSDISIKPKAGSIIFFPCTATHEAAPVNIGIDDLNQKYYIFMVIHSEFGYSTSVAEPYQEMNLALLRSKGVEKHYLLDIDYNKLDAQ